MCGFHFKTIRVYLYLLFHNSVTKHTALNISGSSSTKLETKNNINPFYINRSIITQAFQNIYKPIVHAIIDNNICIMAVGHVFFFKDFRK